MMMEELRTTEIKEISIYFYYYLSIVHILKNVMDNRNGLTIQLLAEQ